MCVQLSDWGLIPLLDSAVPQPTVQMVAHGGSEEPGYLTDAEMVPPSC